MVGAAETTRIGVVPDMSEFELVLDGALNAMADAGIDPAAIDGVATAPSIEIEHIVHALGIVPTWLDTTQVGGCSFMHHVQHATAAIHAGHCRTVLIAMAESGRSRVGAVPWTARASGWDGQFEAPFGGWGPPVLFTLPALRYMKETGLGLEQLANVAVVQREWAASNPRAKERDPITIDDVLSSRMIAYPFTKLMCCLVTDGGGALILTSAERARDFPKPPVYVMGTGASTETFMASQLEDFTRSRAFRVSGRQAFAAAGIGPGDVDHLMLYDAFAHLPIFGLEDLGFVGRGEAGAFIQDGHTRLGGSLPLNTNGGGLSYTHSGMYGMYALQESVRQLRGDAPAQLKDVKISVAHGVGGNSFCSAGTVVLSNEIG